MKQFFFLPVAAQWEQILKTYKLAPAQGIAIRQPQPRLVAVVEAYLLPVSGGVIFRC